MNTLTAIDQLYNDYITRLDGDSEESAAALRECRAELLKLKPRATRAEQNNELIAMIIEHVQDAERGAFAAGLLAAENGGGYTEPSGGHGTPADSFPQ